MAEGPKITRSDDGLYVRCEFDAHYISDEDAQRIRGYIDQLQAENAKLRNEVNNLLDFEHLTSVAVAYAGCDECGEYKQTMLRLFAENDKLRKLLSELYEDQCDDGDKWKYCDRMCELGIEVE